MKSKKIKILISILIIVLIISIVPLIVFRKNPTELKTIASEKQLERIYNNDTDYSTTDKILINLVAMPFNIISGVFNGYFDPIMPLEPSYYDEYITDGFIPPTFTIDSSASASESDQKNLLNPSSSSSKDLRLELETMANDLLTFDNTTSPTNKFKCCFCSIHIHFNF